MANSTLPRFYIKCGSSITKRLRLDSNGMAKAYLFMLDHLPRTYTLKWRDLVRILPFAPNVNLHGTGSQYPACKTAQ